MDEEMVEEKEMVEEDDHGSHAEEGKDEAEEGK